MKARQISEKLDDALRNRLKRRKPQRNGGPRSASFEISERAAGGHLSRLAPHQKLEQRGTLVGIDFAVVVFIESVQQQLQLRASGPESFRYAFFEHRSDHLRARTAPKSGDIIGARQA